VVIICLVALGARLALVIGHPDARPVADAADYDRHALSLARVGTYPPSKLVRAEGPTAFRPPGYPYLLAAAYRLTGTTGSERRTEVGRALGALLGLVAVLFVGLIARRIWGPKAGILAMGIAAVYPPLITVGDALLSESLFTCLVLAGVWSVLKYRSSPRIGWLLAAGALAGLAALTRTNGIVVLVALIAGVALPRRPRRRQLADAAVLLVTAVVMIVPWTIRNAIAMDAFVPVSDQDGFTLEGTYNDVSRLDSKAPGAWRPVLVPPYLAVLMRPNIREVDANQRLRSLAFKYIEDHPTYLGKVAFWNMLRLTALSSPGKGADQMGAAETGISLRSLHVNNYAFYVLALLGFVAAAVGGWRGAPVFVWLVPLFLVLSLIFVISSPRYRVPCDPFLVLVAASGIARWVSPRRLVRRHELGLHRAGND
jgi:4-amino-4-deoxy-L-arabinose transferase-like glycosyltransferase